MTTLAPILADLPKDKATQLEKAYADLKTQADGWMAKANEIKVTDVSQVKEMKLARESRLALVKVRGMVEKLRLSLVADAKQYTQAVDAYARGIREESERVEAVLFDAENFAIHQENLRKEAARTVRAAVLDTMGIDARLYQLGEMTEADWQTLHAGLVAAKEQSRVAAELLAKKQEEERLERIRIAAENERLRKEAVAAKAEADRIAAEQRAKDKAASDAIAMEKAKAQRILDQQKQEAAAKLAAERLAALERNQAQQRVVDQQNADLETVKKRADEAEALLRRQEAQRRAESEAIEARRVADLKRAAEAPDAQKIRAFLDAINSVEIPEVKSSTHQAAVALIVAVLMKLENDIARMIK